MNHRDVVEHFGTATKAAKRLGVTKQAVSVWKLRGIPPGRQALIQIQTRGRLRADNPMLVPVIEHAA